jgi:hypothetical protein
MRPCSFANATIFCRHASKFCFSGLKCRRAAISAKVGRLGERALRMSCRLNGAVVLQKPLAVPSPDIESGRWPLRG